MATSLEMGSHEDGPSGQPSMSQKNCWSCLCLPYAGSAGVHYHTWGKPGPSHNQVGALPTWARPQPSGVLNHVPKGPKHLAPVPQLASLTGGSTRGPRWVTSALCGVTMLGLAYLKTSAQGLPQHLSLSFGSSSSHYAADSECPHAHSHHSLLPPGTSMLWTCNSWG